MSHKIKANIAMVQKWIDELCEEPISPRAAERLVTYHKAYKILCEMSRKWNHDLESSRDDGYKVDVSVVDGPLPHFDRQMAMDWTKGLANVDGTKGPHWTIEETNKLLKQYSLDCDPEKFWAVMNSLYSDYCEALRESGISTPEVYVRLAKAWIKDKDAVSDKAAAYYTYIVEH